MAAYNAKSHVFGSVKASINCSFLKCLFSTPVWFSFVIHVQPKHITPAMITYFDTSNGLCPFFLRQKPSSNRGVREQEAVYSDIREWKNGFRDDKDAHKKDSAVMRVSNPVMIINLEKRK